MTVADHLTLNELWRRAKKAKDPIEKDRFLAVYHAKRGLTAKEIARIIPNTPAGSRRRCGATTWKAQKP
jgi:hypothetical protein